MGRFADRLLALLAPKTTVSACSGTWFCNSPNTLCGSKNVHWYRYCCPDSGCQTTMEGCC